MKIFDWSTTAGSNGSADSTINFAEGQLPPTLNNSARALMARVKAMALAWGAAMTNGGSSSAYTIANTAGHTISAYAAGMRYTLKANHTSATSATLNVDGVGAKKIYRADGTQAGSGDIVSGALYDLVYDATLDSAAGGFKIVGPPLVGSFQPIDATLTAIAALVGSNGQTLRWTGTDTFTLQTAVRLDSAQTFTAQQTIDVTGSGLLVQGGSSGVYLARFQRDQGSTGFIDVKSSGSYVQALLDFESGTAFALGTNGTNFKISSGATGFTGVGGGGATDLATLTTSLLSLSVPLQAAVATSSETSGTLTTASANKVVLCSGDITINDGVFSAGTTIIGYAGAASRTITQDTGMTLRLDGSSTTGNRTVAARGMFFIYFISNSEAVVGGSGVT